MNSIVQVRNASVTQGVSTKSQFLGKMNEEANEQIKVQKQRYMIIDMIYQREVV